MAPASISHAAGRRRALAAVAPLATAALVLAVAAVSSSATHAQALTGKRIPDRIAAVTVDARPITHFQRDKPDRHRFGRLTFLGGLVLTSPAPAFGGFSGLRLDPDGRRLLAITDAGGWMTGQIVYRDGRPAGIRDPRMGPLKAPGGRAITSRLDIDAEGLTLIDGTLQRGRVLIAFERNARIGRYAIGPDGLGPPDAHLTLPAEASAMRDNRQFESVAMLRGGPAHGAIVAFAEEMYDAARNHTGWIWPGGTAAKPQSLKLVNRADFAVTDLAALADGSLVVLERYFRWSTGVRLRMRLVPAGAVRPGALIDGETLIEADYGYEIDNMEGLAAHRDAAGRTVLTLISDDNFNAMLQRTLLLQFALSQPVTPQRDASPTNTKGKD